MSTRQRRPPKRTRSSNAWTFQALHEIAVALSGVLDPAALARMIADRASKLLAADAVALYLWDEEANLLCPLYSNDSRGVVPDRPLPPAQGIIGQAFIQRQPVVVEDYALWSHALPLATERGLQSALAVPLVVAERGVGTLVVRSYSPRTYNTGQPLNC
jgi:transcriptional regulator with GAF, ATPase, and Fis domain